MGQIKHTNIEKVLPRTGLMQSADVEEPIKDQAKTICPCTKAIRVIPSEESAIIQDGILFKAEIKLALGPETEKFLVFETPAATEEDPLYILWGTDIVKGDVNNIDYELYEDTTWVGNAAQPIININRVLAATALPQTLLFETTVATPVLTAATQIDLDAVLGAQITGPQTSPAGGQAAGIRFNGPLKPSTKHAIRLYNNDGALTANLIVKSAFIEMQIPGLYAKVNP